MELDTDRFIQDYFQALEGGLAQLSSQERGAAYRPCAIQCVKNMVYPELRRQFEECGSSLDAQYAKYGDTPYFSAKVIEPGHVYELGYPRCLCPVANAGLATTVSHCECSRQSILYVLQQLLPDRTITVELIETVLSGGDRCRFRATVE